MKIPGATWLVKAASKVVKVKPKKGISGAGRPKTVQVKAHTAHRTKRLKGL